MTEHVPTVTGLDRAIELHPAGDRVRFEILRLAAHVGPSLKVEAVPVRAGRRPGTAVVVRGVDLRPAVDDYQAAILFVLGNGFPVLPPAGVYLDREPKHPISHYYPTGAHERSFNLTSLGWRWVCQHAAENWRPGPGPVLPGLFDATVVAIRDSGSQRRGQNL